MLVNDVLERQTGRIELLDVEVRTGKDLLFFMYSGKLKEGSDLPGLLVLADKYDIQVNWCYVILCAEVADPDSEPDPDGFIFSCWVPIRIPIRNPAFCILWKTTEMFSDMNLR
jgi:hypothetical protein